MTKKCWESADMKKFFAILLAALLSMSCLSAMAETTKVAVIYSATVDDKGWCQAMDAGIKNAIAQGCDIEYNPIETVAVPDAASTIDQLVDNYDIIVAHGAQFANAITEVAAENPDQVFVVGTSDQIMGDNIFTYMPASEEPGYINGYISGLLSKTGKAGVVGSADSGDAKRYVRGFVLGFRAACPDQEDPAVTWTGSFDDTVQAGDIATIMIDANCDMLTGSSQQAVGALRKVAASENAKWAAQTLAQMADFPEVTVCAADYEYAAVIINVIAQVNEGVKGGICIPMNYNNGGFVFQFSENSDLISDEVKAAAAEVLQQITDNPGSIDYASVELQ